MRRRASARIAPLNGFDYCIVLQDVLAHSVSVHLSGRSHHAADKSEMKVSHRVLQTQIAAGGNDLRVKGVVCINPCRV